MSKNLVIVESPAKAKTIEKFLGADYRVLSSQGHIRDIEGVGKNNIGIDFTNHYAPHYEVSKDKERIVDTLRKEADKAQTIWLASDEDREGEAIAWHLKDVLQLPDNKTHRIAFHEITKSAIEEAIAHPRTIDYNLVNAQQARRVIDRIVGFELSPVLWRKVATGLSAGRVQSVAVRLVVEREREIENFNHGSAFRVLADFTATDNSGKKTTLKTELNHRFATEQEARDFLSLCAQVPAFRVNAINAKPTKRTPAPPFTTSLLQQEAARKLRFPVSKTMRLAQGLYEAGQITYMRTDSVQLSSLALNTAKQQILAEYGSKYHQARQYHTTTKGAQEAHEAIRPTYLNRPTIKGSADEVKLYELIYKRTIASQMADAELLQTRIEIGADNCPYLFVASGEQVLFDGFMRVYQQSTDDDEPANATEQRLPALTQGQTVTAKSVSARQTFLTPPQRYNEATLVRKMEELEIGRPSTYASIIETIQSRGYVRRGNVQGQKRPAITLTLTSKGIDSKTTLENFGAESQRLLPTDLGRITNDFLVEAFPEILSYDFTAREEENFDKVAEGHKDWEKVVDAFYKTFHPLIADVPKGKIEGRLLGNDPKTGEPVYARISKNGPCIQLGTTDGDKPRFASLVDGQSIFTITLDEALALFQNALPRTLGTNEQGEEIIVGAGKYGPFVKCADVYASLPKGADPYTITMSDALELIAKKQKAALPIHVWGDIQVLNGRYGPYIKQGDMNYKIPRTTNAAELTESKAREIIAATEKAAAK